MAFPLSSPVEVSDSGPVELRLTDTTAANQWIVATDLAQKLQIRTPLNDVLNLYASGTAEAARFALRRGGNTVTLDTDPALASSYTYNLPASPPSGGAQVIASSGGTNVFYDVHPANLIVVRTNPGPNEYSSVAAAIAAAVTPSTNNRYVIHIYPGTYSSAAFTVPSWVFIRGEDRDGCILTQTGSGSFLTMSADSGLCEIKIRNTNAASPAILIDDQPGEVILRNLTMEGCAMGIMVSVSTSATAATSLTLENSVIKSALTYAVAAGNDIGSSFGADITINGLETNGHSDNGLIFDGALTTGIVQNSKLLGDGTGVGALVSTSAFLDFSGSTVTGWTTGISVPVGGSPRLYTTGNIFQTNGSDLLAPNTSLVGRWDNYASYLQTVYPKSSPFFVVNKDQRIITVAKKGGDNNTYIKSVALTEYTAKQGNTPAKLGTINVKAEPLPNDTPSAIVVTVEDAWGYTTPKDVNVTIATK